MLSFENAILIAWALAVALSDCRRRSIPNSLVLAGGMAALAFAAWRASPFDITFESALLGTAAGFAALLPFYLLNLMGAADIKLFAAVGAWCGPHALVGIWIAASLAALVHALILLARRIPVRQLRDFPANTPIADFRRATTPFGALLAFAVIAHLALHALEIHS
jgi:prepilin peptidase CpaA